ncbi:UDP-glycosyltransferase 87A2 [Sesamum alatum]|uniref:UDP-glycosyltransferase 87A2 n=1 Tax=Sesamum alatum TaxID=300844 RepID=A0AAE2CZR2_9LAMI|nr:UDP-glycosyltransferase 87A2 [Sesamum alatum]
MCSVGIALESRAIALFLRLQSAVADAEAWGLIAEVNYMDSIVNQKISPCHVLAVPYPGRGHINPMLDLCSAVAQKSTDILVTVVLTEEWISFIGSVSKPPNVRFATIPNVLPSELVRGADPRGFWTAVSTKMEEPVERLLDQLRLPLAIVIADAFLIWAGDVAGRRNIPLASLWPMSASAFTVFYHFDLLVQNGHFPINISENGDEIVDYIPGLPPLLVRDLPKVMRKQEDAPRFLRLVPRAKFLIFSSIYELESQVINALKQQSPYSIYNIGPAASYHRLNHIYSNYLTSPHQENVDDYLQWLDCQPPRSVLYVSLGSFLSVSAAQMDEIAAGLHESGCRFLWVTRVEKTRLEKICGEKGLVVGWCDQLYVLCHPSQGGFWTHCGWNSTKEAVLAGMPLLTFPIVMDQAPNAKAIVEDWKMGWRVTREYDEDNLASSSMIAEIVQRFMDLESPERKELTRNARQLQEACEREFANGQSFHKEVEGFATSILENRL